MRRRIKTALGLCAACALCLLAAYGAWIVSLQLWLLHEKSAIEALGVPDSLSGLDDYARKLLGGKPDATPLFQEAQKLFAEAERQDGRAFPPFPKNPANPSAEEVKEADAYLKPRSEALKALKKAVDAGATADARTDIRAQHAAIRLESLCERKAGRDASAAMSLACAMKLPEAWTTQPLLGYSLFESLQSDLDLWLAEPGASEESLKILQAALERLSFDEKGLKIGVARAIAVCLETKDDAYWEAAERNALNPPYSYDRAAALNWLDGVFHLPGKLLPLEALRSKSFDEASWLLAEKALALFHRVSGSKISDTANRLHELHKYLLYLKKKAPDEACRAIIKRAKRSGQSYGAWSGDDVPCVAGRLLSENLRRADLLAVALRRFESGHGRLPETLTELVPEFLEKLPADPFEGKPYLLRLGTARLMNHEGEGFEISGGNSFVAGRSKSK